MQALDFTADPFGGVAPDPDALSQDPKVFEEDMRRSMSVWESDGYRVVWLRIPISKSRLVPVAVELGFKFHHAEEDYLLLTRRLVDGAIVPPYATHYTGVGGVVINPAQQLLVVSERYRQRSRGPAYKLPGGALHPGEHLVDGVIREVLEETGVRTTFESLVCFRHWHGYRFGKSDIYFVCRLSPLSQEITMQQEEIAECRWMPVDDFLGDEDVSLFNKTIVRAALETPGVVPATIDGYGDPARFEFFMPPELAE